jgi:hypothetical protein
MISNYLSNRSKVVFGKDGSQSKILYIFRGMPQGGNLCCLLFSAYLDLPSILDCSYCAFADELQIYASDPQKDFPDIVSRIVKSKS